MRTSLLKKTAGVLAVFSLLMGSFALAMPFAYADTATTTNQNSLAEDIICDVDTQLGDSVPFDPQLGNCGDNGGTGTTTPPTMQCMDGMDNDHDGLTDLADPDCDNAADDTESGTMGTSTGTTTPPAAQCADTIDNDQDGVTDLADPDCSSASDNTESGTSGAGGSTSTTTSTVTIYKYVDGAQATSGNTNNASFVFSSTLNNASGTATSTGDFTLGSGNSYQIGSGALTNGSSFGFHEITSDMASSSNTLPVGAQCQDGMWRQVGYRMGSSLANAQAAAESTTAPSFSSLSQNQVVIVDNEMCTGSGTGTTTDAALHVDSVDAIDTTATADDSYADGWQFVFHITAPNGEKNLAMRFSDWFSTQNASTTFGAANNIRISSAQASSTAPVTITAANAYSTPPLVLTSDLNAGQAGRQVDVLVEVKVPSGTPNDTFSTSYGVQTLP